MFELKTCICSHPAAETKVGLIFLRVSKKPENQPRVSPQPKRCTDVSCGCPEKISGLRRLQPPSLSSRIMCCLDGGVQSPAAPPAGPPGEKVQQQGRKQNFFSSCFLQTGLNSFLHFTNLLHSNAHFFIFSRRAGKIKRFHVFPDTKHFSLSFNSRLSIQQLGMSLFGEGWTSKASEETAEPESSAK